MNPLTRVERLDDIFPEMIRRIARPLWLAQEATNGISLDLWERDKDFQVRAEIPGAKKEDIHVKVDGNFVSINAELKGDKADVAGARMLISETHAGNISRGFSLPQDVDSKGVVAKLEDGILHITLPKREGGGSRAITIQ